MLSAEEIRKKYQIFLEKYPEYTDAIRLDFLPFERFRVYECWKPDLIKVLLLTEAPSCDQDSKGQPQYFYNEQAEITEGSLSWNIFGRLGMTGASKRDRLEKFVNREFFLVDTMKCIFNKNRIESIPTELITYSAKEILQEELNLLNPNYILVLGKTALLGLKYTELFSEPLRAVNNIEDACARGLLDLGTKTLLFSAFPNWRNLKKYGKCINSAFEMLAKL